MSLFEELKRRNVFRVAIAYGVVSWLVVQVAEVATDSFEAPSWVIKTFILFLVLGFPFALIFAWAYELTPEGLKKEKDVDRTQSITHQTGHKLDRTIIVILALALGWFAWDKFATPDNALLSGQNATQVAGESADAQSVDSAAAETVSGEPAQRSIAVLPFVDMSPAKDNEYFTDGLTEELLNILAQIKSLQVAGRTSSFAFKDKTEDLRDIGSKLNVNTLLEGSVRKDDQRQRIRVTVQLINVEDGYHIWSDTYDRDLEDIFAIQEDIAQSVAQALKINLLGEEAEDIAAHGRTGMNAYDLYLQGLQLLNQYSFESLREAEKLLMESRVLDPAYLPTSLALARTWVEQAATGAIAAPEAISRANPVLDEILLEDPNNSEALSYRAEILEYQDQYAEARAFFERALESNPRNARALTKYGRFLFSRSEVDNGLAMLQRASRIEPYDVGVQWELCATQAILVDIPKATRECERIGEIEAASPMQHYGKSYLYFFLGDFPQGLYWHAKAMELDPSDPELRAGAALSWIDLGDLELAEDMLQEGARIDPDHPFIMATRVEVLLHQEQYQQALTLAQAAYDADLPERQGSGYIIERLLVDDAVKNKDYARALNILIKNLPDDVESPFEVEDITEAGLLANIAMVMKLQDPASGQVPLLLDHAEALNDEIDGRMRPFEKPFTQAMIESARGNKTAAIAALQESVDKGWRFDWWFTMNHDFQFEPLRQEPEFQQLTAFLESDMERQREEAYVVLGLTRD